MRSLSLLWNRATSGRIQWPSQRWAERMDGVKAAIIFDAMIKISIGRKSQGDKWTEHLTIEYWSAIFLFYLQNHTGHNQSYKAHRNGIKKPTKQRYSSRKGWVESLIKIFTSIVNSWQQLFYGCIVGLVLYLTWIDHPFHRPDLIFFFLPLCSMDPKFLRNQRFAIKNNKAKSS